VTEHLQYFEDKEQFRVNLTLQICQFDPTNAALNIDTILARDKQESCYISAHISVTMKCKLFSKFSVINTSTVTLSTKKYT